MRRLVLATALAAAAAALGTSPAHAQNLEVSKEETDNHCEAVMLIGHTVDGGCEVHLPQHQTARFYANTVSGQVLIAACDLELWMSIDEEGFGYFHSQVIQPAACPVWPCQEPSGAKKEWSFLASELSTNVERVHTTWCLRGTPGGGEYTCTIDFTLTTYGTHAYQMAGTYTTPPTCQGGLISIAGYWRTEMNASTNIEITHL
jgi:hypothetical protein